MRTVVVGFLTLALACCSSGSGGSGPPSLIGSWYYVDSAGTAGEGLTFNSDETYVNQSIALTSSTTGDQEVEMGTFTLSGSTITVTPTSSSCPGPAPVTSYDYSFQGAELASCSPSTAAKRIACGRRCVACDFRLVDILHAP